MGGLGRCMNATMRRLVRGWWWRRLVFRNDITFKCRNLSLRELIPSRSCTIPIFWCSMELTFTKLVYNRYDAPQAIWTACSQMLFHMCHSWQFTYGNIGACHGRYSKTSWMITSIEHYKEKRRNKEKRRERIENRWQKNTNTQHIYTTTPPTTTTFKILEK